MINGINKKFHIERPKRRRRSNSHCNIILTIRVDPQDLESIRKMKTLEVLYVFTASDSNEVKTMTIDTIELEKTASDPFGVSLSTHYFENLFYNAQ